MKLVLNRNGKFPCHWINTENMCGTIKTTEPIYNYDCRIETADILDKHGFIMDQLLVDDYFQNRYTQIKKGSGKSLHTRHAAISCEQIAINGVNEIKKILEDHLLKTSGMSLVHKIAVTISFGPGHASITAEWTPETERQAAKVILPIPTWTPTKAHPRDKDSTHVPIWKRKTIL